MDRVSTFTRHTGRADIICGAGLICTVAHDTDSLFHVSDSLDSVRAGVATQENSANRSQPSRKFLQRQNATVKTRMQDSLRDTRHESRRAPLLSIDIPRAHREELSMYGSRNKIRCCNYSYHPPDNPLVSTMISVRIWVMEWESIRPGCRPPPRKYSSMTRRLAEFAAVRCQLSMVLIVRNGTYLSDIGDPLPLFYFNQ